MNYSNACDYILNIPKFTKKNSLEQNREFLSNLGNPGMEKKIIHVAGTNGKGSVCAYIQEMLLAQGKRTGFFSSPHLQRMNERIRVNGTPVSDEAFVSAFSEVKKVVDKMAADGRPHPTFFEFLFGMAMTAFERENTEYIILEAGLGGRLDVTNIVEHPAICVLTSVGMDHMEILGDTLSKIASEKAGIIKTGVPVLFMEQTDEVTEIIEKQAKKKGAPCIKISKNAYEIQEITDKDIAFSICSEYYKYTVWKLQNIGFYQVENACMALEAVRCLGMTDKSLNTEPENLKDALYRTSWEGRMEELAPGVYVDGAHNVDAVAGFVESVNGNPYFSGKKKVILFSAVKEKEYERIIAYLCENLNADTYVITKIENDRGVSAGELAALFKKYTAKKVVVCRKLEEAFVYAEKEKGEEGRLFCLGSLYLAGMIRELTGGAENA